MKALILGGNAGFWRSKEKPSQREITSGVEAWVYALDGDHCNTIDATQELVNSYDLVIGNTNRGDYRPKLLELQRNRKEGIQWVSLIEGCGTDYLTLDETTKAILDGSDLVNVINRLTLDFFRSCTPTRCEYIGIPYPAATIRERFFRGERRNVWVPSNLYNSHISCSSALAALPVTRTMGTECHGFHRKPVRIKRKFGIYRPRSAQQGEAYGGLLNDVVFHHEMKMESYCEILSKDAFAFMNLDHRFTWARDVLDCAALQIPCIATLSTGHGPQFFPDLSVPNEFSVKEARELLERLYTDREFYERCSQVPLERLKSLSHENMKRKLLESLE